MVLYIQLFLLAKVPDDRCDGDDLENGISMFAILWGSSLGLRLWGLGEPF